MDSGERGALQEELTALARGDRAAFDPVFRRLWPLLRGFAGRFLPRDEADDVAQEALLRVFARSSEFDTRRDALSWVLGVAAWQKTILRALAHYGAYVGDTGGSWGFETESGVMYTSLGYPDPWVAFAQANGWDHYQANVWVGHLRDGVDWSRMRVVAPCAAQGTC